MPGLARVDDKIIIRVVETAVDPSDRHGCDIDRRVGKGIVIDVMRRIPDRLVERWRPRHAHAVHWRGAELRAIVQASTIGPRWPLNHCWTRTVLQNMVNEEENHRCR